MDMQINFIHKVEYILPGTRKNKNNSVFFFLYQIH